MADAGLREAGTILILPVRCRCERTVLLPLSINVATLDAFPAKAGPTKARSVCRTGFSREEKLSASVGPDSAGKGNLAASVGPASAGKRPLHTVENQWPYPRALAFLHRAPIFPTELSPSPHNPSSTGAVEIHAKARNIWLLVRHICPVQHGARAIHKREFPICNVF